MQWSPDRNGGFSTADFAQLYLPPLMDPVYGFHAVNVEAERRDPGSFLNWLRRMLHVRRQHPLFGLGGFELLEVSTPSVFAYLRDARRGRRARRTRCCASTTSPRRRSPRSCSCRTWPGVCRWNCSAGCRSRRSASCRTS